MYSKRRLKEKTWWWSEWFKHIAVLSSMCITRSMVLQVLYLAWSETDNSIQVWRSMQAFTNPIKLSNIEQEVSTRWKARKHVSTSKIWYGHLDKSIWKSYSKFISTKKDSLILCKTKDIFDYMHRKHGKRVSSQKRIPRNSFTIMEKFDNYHMPTIFCFSSSHVMIFNSKYLPQVLFTVCLALKT